MNIASKLEVKKYLVEKFLIDLDGYEKNATSKKNYKYRYTSNY